MKLTQKSAQALKLPAGKTDHIEWDDDLPGFGLRLRSGEGGQLHRSWCVQYRFRGRSRRLTYKNLTAVQARAKAEADFARVTLGEDPAADKEKERASAATTFRTVVADHLAMAESKLRPASYYVKRTYLTGDRYFKPLHSRSLGEIGRADIARCLNRITLDSGRVTSSRARAHLSAFFTWAMKQGYVDTNPVIATEDAGQGKPRERVLSDSELAAVWKATPDDTFGKIVRLLILTACRRDEIGGLQWSEIAPDRSSFTLPAERTKNHRAHTLPLLPLAQAIIESVPQVVGRDPLFGVRADGFNGFARMKKALDERLLGKVVDAWTLHDLRRTVATRMVELDVEPHVVEAVLNHRSGHRAGVAGVYNRSRYEKQMKIALARWHDHLQSLIDKSRRKILAFPQAQETA